MRRGGLTVDKGGATVTDTGLTVTTGVVTVGDSTDATSSVVGSLKAAGGLGITKKLVVGGSTTLQKAVTV